MKGWSILIMAAFASLLQACGDEDEAQGASGGGGYRAGAAARKEAALPVRTETVTRGEITRFIETHARLEAERWVEVVARTQGLARQLAVEEGDRVRAGDLLVQLDKEELQLRLDQARVALGQAASALDRTTVLHERQLVSQEEFEGARNQHDNAAVGLQEAQLQLAYTEIRAPIDGVVMLRSVELGDLVRGNDVVFVVADLEPLQARIRVPEKRMAQVRPGQAARIAVDTAPDRTFPAVVRMISPGVDPASGTVKVTLNVQAEGILRPGMFSTVRIVTDSRPDALIVPKKALVLETDEDDVFAVRDGKAQRLRVELGYTDGERVQIVSGLEAGDQVITVGHEGLKDNAAVRIVGSEGG